MKYSILAIGAAFVLFGFQGPAPEKAASGQVKQNSDANQQTSPKTAPVNANSAENNQEKGRNETHQDSEESVRIVSAPKIFTESKKDIYDKTLIVCTMLLVIVGGFQVIFLWRTVNAARDNAKAALLSAEAIINGERAWIVITNAIPPPLTSQPVSGELISSWFGLAFKNRGKTVARITNIQIRFHTVAKISDLPSIPDYTGAAFDADLFFGRPLPPDDEIVTSQRLEGGILAEEQVAKIRQGELIWLIYGCVSYLDFAKNPRKSQFCSVFVVPRGLVTLGINDKERFETGGPKGYNEYT